MEVREAAPLLAACGSNGYLTFIVRGHAPFSLVCLACAHNTARPPTYLTLHGL